MKIPRTWLIAIPASLFLLSACDKKAPAPGNPPEVGGAPVETATSDGGTPEAPTTPTASSLSAEKRAEMLGFVGHLPADTEWVMSLYDGKGMVAGLRSLDAWQLIRDVAKEQEGVDPEEEIAEGAAQIEPFLGQEMFIAAGAGSGKQLAGAAEIQARLSYHQFRTMAKAFAQGAASGDLSNSLSAMSDDAWLMEFAKDIGQFMPIVEDFEVPPLLAGLKITDKDAMGMGEEQIRTMFGEMGEMAEPIEFEKSGVAMSGILLKGETLVEGLEAERDDLVEALGEETTDKLLATLKTKQLVVTLGKMEDYLLLYVGGSTEACPIATDPSGSLAGNDAISFIDGFAGKRVHGFVYASKGLIEQSVRSSLKPMAEGLRDGMKGVDGFGDTREIAALLDMIGKREAELLAMFDPTTVGAVISMDQGTRFDLFGASSGALDYAADPKLAALGEGENILFFANWVSNSDYQEKASDLVELMAETGYAVVSHLARLEVESEQLAQLKGGFEMFDSNFRANLLKLWKGLGTMGGGLGNEAAVVIDLDADFPPIPEVPKGIVEGGRFVRASMIAPVEDRTKLKESWVMVDEAVRELLVSAKEMGAPEFHMLQPTNSETDDMITWYFDAFAFSDDLKPSVTVGDEWFVASTSKTQAHDLVSKAGTASGGRKGAWVKLDLDVLRKYLEEAAKLVDENGEELFPDPDALADFREKLPSVMKGLASMEQFEAVTMHDRMEAGGRQVTLHFKMR